jgi:hypothetical protein
MWLEFIAVSAWLPMPDKDKKFQLRIYCLIDFRPLEPLLNSISSAPFIRVKPAILPMRMLAVGSSRQ